MKKQLTLALFIAALLGILSIGCNRTNEEYTCNPSCEKGGKLLFGKYNGSPIEWYIMSNDTANRRFMLLAMDPLEQRAFNEELAPVTWERSTIRSWLNGYGPSENDLEEDYTSDNFISKAFTRKEKAWIHKTKVVNNDGNPTKDHVFLLSGNELLELLPKVGQVDHYVGRNIPVTKLCTQIRCRQVWWLRDSDNANVQIEGEFMEEARHYGAKYVGNGGLGIFSRAVDGGEYSRDYKSKNPVPFVRPALWMNY